jgi:hypothetical protein
MAHIRRHPRTRKLQVRWRDPVTSKEHNRSFERMTDARIFKRKIEAALDQGSYIDSRSGKTRFADCAEDWFANKLHLRYGSWVRDESYLRNHVLPAFSDMAIGHIRKTHIQAWIRDIQQDLAAATVRNATESPRAFWRRR